MVMKELRTNITKKLGNCRASSSTTPIEQCLRSIVPKIDNIQEKVRQNIESMLSPQYQQYRR